MLGGPRGPVEKDEPPRVTLEGSIGASWGVLVDLLPGETCDSLPMLYCGRWGARGRIFCFFFRRSSARAISAVLQACQGHPWALWGGSAS